MTTAEETIQPESGNYIVTINPKAIKMVKAMILAEENEEAGLRIAVSDGGCSGFKYLIGVQPASQSTDIIYDYEGVKLFIDANSAPYLMGTEIMFEGMSIKLQNPNATKNCSCGSSFGV